MRRLLLCGGLLLITGCSRPPSLSGQIDDASHGQFRARDEPGAVICAHRQVARLGRRVYGDGTCQLFVRRGASARLSSGWGYPWRVTLEPSGSLRLEGGSDSAYDGDVARLFPW